MPPSQHALATTQPACMHVFNLVGLGQLFQEKPCKVDALRIHKLTTSLQENGTCQLTHLDGEIVEVQISRDIVTRALMIQEGNHSFSTMKLTSE